MAAALQMAENLYWQKRWHPDHHRYNFDMNKGPVFIEWFRGGKTNMCGFGALPLPDLCAVC